MSDTGSDYCPACRKDVVYVDDGGDQVCSICGMTKIAAEYAHATEKKVTRRKRWLKAFWIGLGALSVLGFIVIEALRPERAQRLTGHMIGFIAILTAMYLIGGLVYLIFRLILAWRDGWRPLLTRRSRAIAVAWIVWVPIAWSYWNNKIAHHYDDLWEYFLWFILIFGPLLAIPVIRWVARGAPARE